MEMTPAVSPTAQRDSHGAIPDISISIVSHAQMAMVQPLLQDLERISNEISLEVILTLNTPEALQCAVTDFSFPLRILRNPQPLGFGANHNQAFTHAHGEFFCILNPDVRLEGNPFPVLIKSFENSAVALAAPLVKDNSGNREDSARHFPSPLKILLKVFGQNHKDGYAISQDSIFPDWVGGMFMLIPASIFKKIHGFDERFFLYYEDVDLCARLKLNGNTVIYCPQTHIIHQAQRDSHRRFKYLRWHLASMVRFFLSSVYIKIQWQRYKENINL